MTADRNKTELTQNIVRLAALWLDGKGFKPVETEVGVDRGWVADVAGVCCPTPSERINLKLIRRPPRWNAWADKEAYRLARDAWDAENESLPPVLTATVEVKTSTGDYRGDPKWTRPWPTNLCYVAMPEGMMPQEKWPQDWGVILFSQAGTCIRRVFHSKCRTVTTEQQRDVVLSLAVRRDHVTRYARERELQKAVRLKKNPEKNLSRVSDVIHFVRDVMKGKPVDEAMRYNRLYAKLPDHVLRDLDALRPSPAHATETITSAIKFVRDVMRGEEIEYALRWNDIYAELPERLLRDLSSLQPQKTSTDTNPVPCEISPK